jgi:hypothetical protein
LGILRVLTIGFGAGADVRGSQGRSDHPRAICAADQIADYERTSIVRQLGRNGLALTAPSGRSGAGHGSDASTAKVAVCDQKLNRTTSATGLALILMGVLMRHGRPNKKGRSPAALSVELPGIEPVSGCWSLSRAGTELRNDTYCDSPELTSVDTECAQNVPSQSLD